VVNPLTDNCYVPTIELPFYQIGAEQGFLSEVVQVMTGYATPLPGNGFIPLPVPAVGGPTQALLMGNAERADVIVDFTGLDNGTKIRMINTGADSPFGGFPVGLAVAHDNTTGQVMQFVVDNTVLQPSDADTTFPEDLVLSKEPALPAATRIRQVSLNEEVSGDFDPAKRVCVCADEFETFAVPIDPVACTADPVAVCPTGFQNIFAFGPVAAKVGVVDLSNPALPAGIALAWEDTSGTSVPVQVTMADNVTKRTVNVTENPRIVGGVFPVEQWEIYNFTVDAHPIHLHLVEFEVVSRSAIPGQALISGGVSPTESGFKDTVIAYPGEITTVKAKFDIPGLYVWHCHIVEHEDNEMMRPFVVSDSPKRSMLDFDDDGKTDLAVFRPSIGQWWIINSRDGGVTTKDWGAPGDVTVPGDYDGDWKTDVAVYRPSSGQWLIINSSTGLTTTKDWGASGDVPVPGDYDGDGKTDVAVYRPSSGQWVIINSSTGLTTTKDWGAPGDSPAPGDYDGDGKTDVAVYRPSSGQWFIVNSSTGLTTTKDWGVSGDVTVPGDYDGDGKTDVAVYRPSSGQWFIINSSTGLTTTKDWGAPGDVPVKSLY
jgi:hypothetical protein